MAVPIAHYSIDDIVVKDVTGRLLEVTIRSPDDSQISLDERGGH